jgi:hypothetical protein
MQPTKEQIELVMKNVKTERGRLPEISTFGDNNWLALDASIRAMELALKGETPARSDDSPAYECLEWLHNTSSSDFGLDYGKDYE